MTSERSHPFAPLSKMAPRRPAVPVRAMALLLATAGAGQPAHGQTVALLTFDGPASVDNSVDSGPLSGADEAGLAQDFQLLGVGPLSPEWLASTPTTPVPTWMRTGLPPSSTLAPTIYGSGLACAALPYRPRRDLALDTEARRARLFPMVAQAACEAGLPIGLFDALIVQESRYNASVVSPKGAIGLAQLMPGTARYLSVSNPFDALSNLRGGARYLREQLNTFGRVDLALAAYNAGPGRVRGRWAVPRIAETRNYVTSVTRGWHVGVAREAALLDFRLQPQLEPAASRISARSAQLMLFGGDR